MASLEPAPRTQTRSAREALLEELPVRERRLQLAGISTSILEAGNGPPLVLLHGPGGYAAHWMRLIPGLSATHRVIAPDLPGHGSSGVSDRVLDADRVLEWLADLIRQTCASPPVLVGQLIGGAIAARFAARHGERLARLVLIDTFGLSPFQPSPEFGLALSTFLAEPSEENHDKLWLRCARDLETLRRRMGALWQPFKAYNVERARNADQQTALSELMQAFGLPEVPTTELERISIPTALIWGRHDLATPLAVAERASARFGWPLHVIEDANDDPPIEQPEALLQALRGTLSAHTA